MEILENKLNFTASIAMIYKVLKEIYLGMEQGPAAA
jgi:hypothetical protein